MQVPPTVNATVAAVYVREAIGQTVQPGTIRQWAHREHIGNHGHRFSLREIHIYLTGEDPYDDAACTT